MGESDRVKLVESIRQEIKQEASEEPVKRIQMQKYLATAGPLLNDLTKLGYKIDTIDDLRHQGKPWKKAVPVLLHWLPEIEDLEIKESIVRCLSVPWTGNKATAGLIQQFKKYAPIDPHHSQDVSQLSPSAFVKHLGTLKRRHPSASLAWTIGNALSIVDVKGFEKQIIELCRNSKYGEARQMLVFGLGRLRNSAAEEAAIALLNDEDVKLHSIIALGKMKSKRALFELEKLMTDKRPAIRKVARKAVTEIGR